ncbi:MAG: T9SS type A sorting domain-containing protein [Bacteroidetes bacterium]|nr:T9SS type A sorting domain-containing protein [Bacteroidota bacterium]
MTMNPNQNSKHSLLLIALFLMLLCVSKNSFAAGSPRVGKIAQRVNGLVVAKTVFQQLPLFNVSGVQQNEALSQTLKSYTLLQLNATGMQAVLNNAPDFLRVTLPSPNNSAAITLLLYKETISKNGFTLETNDGQRFTELNKIVHYRGIIENDPYSVAALSFSNEETMGIISNSKGNFVLGKIEKANSNEYVFYNDHEMLQPFTFNCGANTLNMVQEYQHNNQNNNPGILSTKCVDWYYETDYDVFVGKGSLANVNSYIQGVFNQVSTMYDNDGVSITLQTLYVWTATDPYTGPTTSNYLSQFGTNRTSFAGDLANLVGYAGGGGIAYVNGLCSSSNNYKMGYMGISSSYNTVPTYSWTVEVVTHEDGHLLGSRHTHDCVWNGNSTAIDGCGDAAGYPGNGSCADGPIPVDGTIMSYCHLVSAGINFSLGFGPQPAALILNNVNNASCLSACSACQTPSQPGSISGASSFCQSSTQTYSVTAVAGATSYLWVMPAGWTGASTTNSITVTTTTTGGTVSVTAVNACGNSTARTLTVTGAAVPGTPGNLIGSTSVCQGSTQTYSIGAVSGATSYIWSLPSGWTGSSATNSITTTTNATGGAVSVVAVNSCGNSSARTITVAINVVPAQPAAITGSASICPNATITYSVTAVSGATSYIWTLPGGWTGTSSTNSIITTATSVGGNVSVAANNGCGTGTVRNLAVAISGAIPATPSTITATAGNTKVCPGDTKIYSIAPVSGATLYTWTLPAGAIITSGQGTSSITVQYQSGFIASGVLGVASTNLCGSSAARTLTITRNTPAKPGVISGPLYGVCNSNNKTYTVTSVAGVTYNWYFSTASAVIATGQGTSNITANFTPNYTSGTLNVTANNACGTSTIRTASVNSILPAATALTGTTSPCANQSGVPYSVTPVAGATAYQWTVPSGSRINDGVTTSTSSVFTTTATNVTVNFKTIAGNVRVNAINACGLGASKTLAVSFSCREATNLNSFPLTVTTYPNPVNNELNIEFGSETATTNQIRVYDVTGKTLAEQKGISVPGINKIQMSTKELKSGIYFVEVLNGDEKTTSKIAVE